jgi:hypothetical protein
MPRTRKGKWLKADALRTAGLGEQWSDGVHVVRLYWDNVTHAYVVTRSPLQFAPDEMYGMYAFADDLHGARKEYRRIVRGYGGRV